ncbi:MAG: NAD(P)/FAD-dependent oxidoreductase [Gemmatimonadaceae bacterium]
MFHSADVAIAGGGLIGRACAAALVERGARVLLLEHASIGEASVASAGMLAPSVERADAAANKLALAARDRYPTYLEWLRERSGIEVPLNRLGILQVALSAAGVKGLRKSANPESQWLDRAELTALEPALAHALGALYSASDGCVDNVALLSALDAMLSRNPLVNRDSARVTGVISTAESVAVTTADGTRYSASHALIAAGAWSAQIEGARLAAVVEPMRGQLVSFAAAPCRHTLYGPRGYLVPRGSSTIAGATSERVGFTPGTTAQGTARLRSAAGEICPVLASAAPAAAWSGFRPMTPDMLPLIGPDPEAPRILYATGHSRNGILLAPLTADIVANLLFEDVLNLNVERYRPDRF